jgi:uncharacterized membrane protein
VYIDWARGVAVLLMIHAHTSDAWTAASSKATPAFRHLTIAGGFAAPLFLWLAGLSVVLSATRLSLRGDSRSLAAQTVCRRGLEMFILAFVFRLQAFALSPGSHPVALFRVDILNIMGLAIVAAGIIWSLHETTWALVASYAAAAAAFALLTPVVWASASVSALPTWLQWHMRPAGEHTTFTLFPWAGFVFAGGACGAVIAGARERTSERRVQVAIALLGATILAVGSWTSMRPSLYPTSAFWTSSPSWFAIQVGVMMLALTALYGVSRIAPGWNAGADPVARLGRHSLFVYWIHVELVYGYSTWPLRGRLPLWGTAIAFATFSALMYGGLFVRDRALSTWRSRQSQEPQSQAVAAAI